MHTCQGSQLPHARTSQQGEGKDEERARPTGKKGVGSVDIGGEKVAIAVVVIAVGGDVPRRRLATSRCRLVASRTAPPRSPCLRESSGESDPEMSWWG
jgi:hypothetical protein